MSIFSKHSPPTRLGIIHPPEHDFFDDPSLFLALDDDDDEEDGSIPPQDSSFLPSDDRLHLETAERERLKSMCITFRANPFAFQEINQNGLGRRTTGPPAQPHASPPLLYNFWADSSASPPPTLPHTSRRTRSHAHSPSATSPPPSPPALTATATTTAPRTPSHDLRLRRDQHPFRPPPRTPQRRYGAQPDPPTRSHPRHALAVKCEEQEPENPLSHPYLQKSPTEWYGIPSSSSTMTNNLQPVALSYGELPSRPQNDQTNSYTSWPPHQAPSARAVYSQSYTPTSSFVPHHLPPMHAYIPTSTTSASASASSGSGSFSPRHFSDDISSTGRAVRDCSESNNLSIIPQSFTEQALHHHHHHHDRSWPRFSSNPPFAPSDPISPHTHQQHHSHHSHHYHHQHNQHGFSATSMDSRRELYQTLVYPASPSDSSPTDSPPSRSLIVSALTDLDLYPSSSASGPNLDDDGMHMNIMQRVS